MIIRTTRLVFFAFLVFSICQLIAGGDELADKNVLTERQTLAIFNLILQDFEKTGIAAASAKVQPISNINEAQKAFEQSWRESGRKATLPTGKVATWEDVREHGGYFFRVFKDEGLNCTILFCKKGGDTIYLVNFGPRYT